MGETDPRLVAVVALELLVVRLLLSGFGYRTAARVLPILTPSPATIVGGSPEPDDVARTVESVADRLPVGTTCLVEALCCKALLDACGVETDLQVGVTKAGEGLEAHAWLTRRGEVLVGGTDEDPDRFRQIAESFEP